MASRRLVTFICSIAFAIYFFVIIFQVPLFGVPCRCGICKTPLQLISSHLIASEVFPHFIVKSLLYPGALTTEFYNQKATPSYKNVLKSYNFNTREFSFVLDLQCLEVIVGSYLSVAGAITGLIRPGRMSIFGIAFLVYGVGRLSQMEIEQLSDLTCIRMYPAMNIALFSALFSLNFCTCTMLGISNVLWTDASTRGIVQKFLATGPFNVEFGKSVVKMGNIELKTAIDGEICRKCSVLN
ncbi:Peroxidase 62 [Spatholobus suberectus]|nr:Peroxidase 62 [Spatholobus suberectus]